MAIEDLEGEPDDEAGGDVDDERAEGKAGAHSAGDRGSDPEAGNGTQGSSNGDEKISLQVQAPLRGEIILRIIVRVRVFPKELKGFLLVTTSGPTMRRVPAVEQKSN